MERSERSVLELGSLDVGLDELRGFKEAALLAAKLDMAPMELIVNSGLSGVDHYSSLGSLIESTPKSKFAPSYLHYSITWPSRARCSLYLDPDRPARIVLEGDRGITGRMREAFSKTFGKGDERFRLHGPIGLFLIWLAVILIASTFTIAYIIGSGSADPMIIIPVIVSSGVLGIYLSFFKLKDINPANTISLGSRQSWVGNMLLNLLTVALGIISAIMSAFILRMALG